MGALLFLAFVFRSGLVREDDELNEAFESEAELLNLRGRKCNFPSAANDGHLSSIHPLVYKIIFWWMSGIEILIPKINDAFQVQEKVHTITD